jgi:hypothetical protein
MKSNVDNTPTIRTTKMQDLTTDAFIKIIRAAQNTDTIHAPKQETPKRNDSRKSIDIYCDAWGSHGHRWRDCDYLAKLIKALDFLNNLEATKKKTLLETFHKEQMKWRQSKRSMAIARATTYLQEQDIESMYNLVHELNAEEESDEKEKGIPQYDDQEWHTQQVHAYATPPPEPAPDWDTIDIIRTIANDGVHYRQSNLILTRPGTLQCTTMELTTDNETMSTVTQSPYLIRYYTSNTTYASPSMETGQQILIRVQIDGGANRSLTNNKDLLSRYQATSTYNIYGVSKEEIALQCIGKGYLPWPSDNGDVLYIPYYYSPNAAETIILPTDVVLSHKQIYTGWAQFTHIDTGRGNITFYRTEGVHHTTNLLKMINGYGTMSSANHNYKNQSNHQHHRQSMR